MKKSKYIIILCVAFMIGLGTNLAHPVTPYLIKDSGWPEYSFSVFFALMSFGMLLFAPIWGSFGDKHGKRIVILLCSLGYSIGQIMFSQFTNIYLVYFARFFSGCFSCGLNVALVSYLTTSKDLKGYDKTRLIPLTLSFQLVGNAIGNFLGGKLGDVINYRDVLLIQAGVLSTFGIIAFLFLRLNDETLDPGIKRNNFIDNFKNVKRIGRWNLIFLLCLTGFSLVFTNAQKYLDYYYSDLGRTSGELGQLSLVIGLVTLVTNSLITPILLRKIKAIPTCIVFGILGSISIAITFSTNNTSLLLIFVYSVFMVYIMSKAIIESSSASFISQNKLLAPGIILGVRQSFLSLGAVIGPLLGGAIYYNCSLEDKKILFMICATLYLLSSIVLLVIYLLRNKFKVNPYIYLNYSYNDAIENNIKVITYDGSYDKCYAVIKNKDELILIYGNLVSNIDDIKMKASMDYKGYKILY